MRDILWYRSDTLVLKGYFGIEWDGHLESAMYIPVILNVVIA